MPLDPVLQGLLSQIPPAPTGAINFPELREQSEAMLPLIIGPAGVVEVKSVESHIIEGPVAEVPIRIYRPLGHPEGTLHFVHGGGWSVGNLVMTDPIARRLCRDLSMVVVASTYRLAPEHAFPAAYDDTLVAATWVRSHVAELGGEQRPLLIGGDSAGANLVAAVCIGFRDHDQVARGISPDDCTARSFDLQLLLYPAVDLRENELDYPSREADADPTLKMAAIRGLRAIYCGDSPADDWRISPLAAADLSNLPPALIVVLQVDPLRDEALIFADKLRASGVQVEVVEFDNLTHGFAHMAGIVPAAAVALGEVLDRVRSMVEGLATKHRG